MRCLCIFWGKIIDTQVLICHTLCISKNFAFVDFKTLEDLGLLCCLPQQINGSCCDWKIPAQLLQRWSSEFYPVVKTRFVCILCITFVLDIICYCVMSKSKENFFSSLDLRYDVLCSVRVCQVLWLSCLKAVYRVHSVKQQFIFVAKRNHVCQNFTFRTSQFSYPGVHSIFNQSFSLLLAYWLFFGLFWMLLSFHVIPMLGHMVSHVC